MGIPIPVNEVDADQERSNICLAADCQCPECRHRHIIRLGSAIRQTRRQELYNQLTSSSTSSPFASTTTTTGEIDNAIDYSGYIDTLLPDYRFRHSISPDSTIILSNSHNHITHNIHNINNSNNRSSDRDGNSNNSYSTSTLLNRRRGTSEYRGPPLPQIMSSSSVSVSNSLSPLSSLTDRGVGIGGSPGHFTTSPTSIDNNSREQSPEDGAGSGQLEVALEAATLEDHSLHQHRHHRQHQYQFQSQSQNQLYQQRPPPSSPLMRMRARAQEWASRIEGVDYYHDSDPEDLLVEAADVTNREEGGGRGGERRVGRTRRRGEDSGHRGIMDRHERSSSAVGIDQSTIR